MSDDAASSDETKSEPTPKYIHPIDLLLYRLSDALRETEDLVELTLGNYELYYYKHDGRSMCGTRLRADAYCNDPKKVHCHEAHHALQLALSAAVGIGQWLRYGLGERAGRLESELRECLKNLNRWANTFPKLPFLPVLEDCFARWQSALARALELNDELGDAAVQSRDPAEWKKALRGAIETSLALDAAFEDYRLAAKDLEADLEKPYAAMVAAMNPAAEGIEEIGPRLLYAFDDSEELQWHIEHLRHQFAQCAGNLQHWRRDGKNASSDLPKVFWETWEFIVELNNHVFLALEGASVHEVDGRVQSASTTTVTTEPLSDAAEKVWQLISKSDKPLMGCEITAKIHGLGQGTLTRHIIPALKKHRGVKNKPGAGYYASKT